MKKKQPTYGGKRRIRKDDVVVVLTGKDRGAQGKVLRVIPDKGRVIVEGVNKIKRATRANPQKNIKGGILEREAPIAISNLMLVARAPFYRVFLVFQLVGFGLAGAGKARLPVPGARLAYYYYVVTKATVAALVRYMRFGTPQTWDKAKGTR